MELSDGDSNLQYQDEDDAIRTVALRTALVYCAPSYFNSVTHIPSQRSQINIFVAFNF